MIASTTMTPSAPVMPCSRRSLTSSRLPPGQRLKDDTPVGALLNEDIDQEEADLEGEHQHGGHHKASRREADDRQHEDQHQRNNQVGRTPLADRREADAAPPVQPSQYDRDEGPGNEDERERHQVLPPARTAGGDDPANRDQRPSLDREDAEGEPPRRA